MIFRSNRWKATDVITMDMLSKAPDGRPSLIDFGQVPQAFAMGHQERLEVILKLYFTHCNNCPRSPPTRRGAQRCSSPSSR